MIALGVDGGNTKTVAVAADAARGRFGSGRGGCADIHNATSVDAALEQIVAAAEGALSEAQIEPADVGAAWFGLAGADWPEDFELLEREIASRLGLRCPARVVNDAITPIRAGTPDGVGVAVVVGTYGICGSRGPAGQVFHVGFWPDDSGARPMAVGGLDAVQRAGLGLGPATALTESVLTLFGASDERDLLHRVTRREEPMTDLVDRVAVLVLDAADGGDQVALDMVEAQCRVLAGQALACARGVGFDPRSFPLVLTGGLLRHPSPRIPQTITRILAGPVPLPGRHHPAIGALLFALDELGAESPAALIAQAEAGIDGHYNSLSGSSA